jgi:hypothetical protein
VSGLRGSGRRFRLTALATAVAAAVAGCGGAPPLDDLPGPTPTATTTPPPTTTPPATSTTPSPTAAPTTKSTPPKTRSDAAPRASGGGASRPTAPAGRSWSTSVTFYGAGDNDPPGSSAIAHPNARHSEAGGTGTFADPVSLASDVREIAVGTIVYYPSLKKYFVMEDDCATCIEEWGDSKFPHIDLWTGDFSGSAFTACQHALTPGGLVEVEVGPPAGRPVDTRPLYTASGGCLV